MSETIKTKTNELKLALHEEMNKIVLTKLTGDQFDTFVSTLQQVPSMHVNTLFGSQFVEYMQSYLKLGIPYDGPKVYRAN
jgi:hypothetical protein